MSKEGKTKIVIDHCFDVKGVGTDGHNKGQKCYGPNRNRRY